MCKRCAARARYLQVNLNLNMTIVIVIIAFLLLVVSLFSSFSFIFILPLHVSWRRGQLHKECFDLFLCRQIIPSVSLQLSSSCFCKLIPRFSMNRPVTRPSGSDWTHEKYKTKHPFPFPQFPIRCSLSPEEEDETTGSVLSDGLVSVEYEHLIRKLSQLLIHVFCLPETTFAGQ